VSESSRQDSGRFAAACGLYCGACRSRLASERKDSAVLEQTAQTVSKLLGKTVTSDDMYCEGCQSDIRTIHCRSCAIRECAFSKGLTHCSQCGDFPCKRLVEFNQDAYPHHHEVLKNIERIREIGIDAWLEEQRARWHCPDCGSASCWYADTCPDCGATLKNEFGTR
jgi:hypothetical protein